MNKTKYTIYKITNLINDKIYIGAHKTDNLDDEYMGSGKHLKHAQNKYGIENFKKEILEVFDTPEEMFEMESLLVNEEFIDRDDVYNLKLGGEGGWDYLNSSGLNKKNHDYDVICAKMRKASVISQKWLRENDPEWVENCSKTRSVAMKKSWKEGTNTGFTGHTPSQEHKDAISSANSKRQSGEGNSQYGLMWIYSLEEKVNKRIPKTEEIPNGWLKGRKMKF